MSFRLPRGTVDIKSVLVVDEYEDCANILRSHHINVTTMPNITHEELLNEAQNHDAIVVYSTTQITREVLDASPRLKLIGKVGIYVDNIDLNAAGDHNIRIINIPVSDEKSLCDINCALTLAMNIVPAAIAVKDGHWDNTQFSVSELKGKNLAIIGLSIIGTEIAKRMHAFGMQLIGFDPYVSEERCSEFNVKKMTLEEIWPTADYIILLHVTLLEMMGRKRLMNAKVFEKCKRGVKIINVGRDVLLEYPDLLDALQSGQVGGVALDIFGEELPTDPVLLEIIRHPAVIATPNHGPTTEDNLKRSAQNIAKYFVNLVKPYTYEVPFPTSPLNKYVYITW